MKMYPACLWSWADDEDPSLPKPVVFHGSRIQSLTFCQIRSISQTISNIVFSYPGCVLMAGMSFRFAGSGNTLEAVWL
jgi:hypothetical protein